MFLICYNIFRKQDNTLGLSTNQKNFAINEKVIAKT